MKPGSDRQPINIRPASVEDWPTLWPLLQAMGQVDSEAGVRTRLRHILTRDDHFLCVALTAEDSAVIGYAWVQDYGFHLRSGKSIARLNDIYVKPEHRQSGIGTLLLRAATGWAIERGVTWLQWQSSAQALPFYERLGLVGDPCPDREHPFYEIDFSCEDWREKLRCTEMY